MGSYYAPRRRAGARGDAPVLLRRLDRVPLDQLNGPEPGGKAAEASSVVDGTTSRLSPLEKAMPPGTEGWERSKV